MKADRATGSLTVAGLFPCIRSFLMQDNPGRHAVAKYRTAKFHVVKIRVVKYSQVFPIPTNHFLFLTFNGNGDKPLLQIFQGSQTFSRKKALTLQQIS
ncbi:MAG: hypothetical protein IIC13_14435 [SAR324 cluster bacterium]|nr:hypothetical protein [SAR324 cluster bacterium]